MYAPTKGDPDENPRFNSFVSLDGVMQAPGGPDEDPTGGFTLGGWAVNYFDAEMLEQVAESDPYELLLGRGTYEIFAAHWPYDEGPIANQLNGTRKHVASRTLSEVDWNNSTLISGDVAEYVAELKRQDGPEIQVHGSPGLIQTLLEHDLIDEYRLWIFPVVVGAGKRFFGAARPGALKLINSRISSTGVTINTYQRAGDIEGGDTEFEEPSEAELERRRRLGAPRLDQLGDRLERGVEIGPGQAADPRRDGAGVAVAAHRRVDVARRADPGELGEHPVRQPGLRPLDVAGRHALVEGGDLVGEAGRLEHRAVERQRRIRDRSWRSVARAASGSSVSATGTAATTSKPSPLRPARSNPARSAGMTVSRM